MRMAFFQPIGGASGDMLLGALVDAGAPLDGVRRHLARLNLGGYRLEAAEETRCEVRGLHLQVHLEDTARRSPAELLHLVESSGLDSRIKEQSAAVLRALWQAEERVHGWTPPAAGTDAGPPPELEELGSIDTLVDVVGVCAALGELGVDQVYAAPLLLGEPGPPRRPGGYANPAPATLELLAAAAAPVAAASPLHQGAGELTTPTGAALLTTLAEFRQPACRLQRIGVGLGTRNPAAFPNALRVWLGELTPPPPPAGPLSVGISGYSQADAGENAKADIGGYSQADAGENAKADIGEYGQAGRLPIFRPADVVLLETNLDDATGVMLGYVLDGLFALGALDVWHTPIQMKKNRPGVLLSALTPPDLETAAVEFILRETTTLGVRVRRADRYVAQRESHTIDTPAGPVSVKVKLLDGVPVSAAPEPDDCRRLAQQTGRPFQEIYQEAAETARRQLLS